MTTASACENCGTTDQWVATLEEVDGRWICYPCRELIAEDAQSSDSGAAPDDESRPFAQPLADFIADKRDAPEPLVGTADDCIIPALGLRPADRQGRQGQDDVLRRLRPTPRERHRLPRARRSPARSTCCSSRTRDRASRSAASSSASSRAGQHELGGAIYVYDQNWGHARLDLPEFVARLNEFCAEQRDRPGDRRPARLARDGGRGLAVGDPGDGRPLQGRGAVLRARLAGPAPLAQGVGRRTPSTRPPAPGADARTRCSRSKSARTTRPA